MQKLAETYDNCSSEIGSVFQDEKGKNRSPLLPIAHTTQNMQIEVTIDIEGNFKGARLISALDASTIIPCTESSSGRTSGLEPHPLCDSLQYIASDYVKYGGRKKHGFAVYEKQLRNWCDSIYAHPKATAVLKYISKGNVIADLVNHNILQVDDNNHLVDKWDKKLYKDAQNRKQDESFVRFIVWESGNKQSTLWDDKSLHESWQKYYASTNTNLSLCYISGKVYPVAEQHPRFIRNSGDGAKLISSNDTHGFTYRGRFRTASSACSISYEISQKAHNALKWLIGRQGQVFLEKGGPGLTVVAWATSGLPVPDPLNDTLDIIGLSDLNGKDEQVVYTAQDVAIKLAQKVAGYNTVLGETADVIVMGLNSATPGRMAINFYRELKGSDFINRIDYWHNTCCWEQQYSDNGKKKFFTGAPSPRIIAEAAYGSKIDDKLLKTTVERLLPSIVDSRKIPHDLVEVLVRRSSNRMGIKNEWEWETTMRVACALYRKYRIDYKKEDIGMVLDHNRATRDYLYGRLLAIADVLEQKALNKSEKNRPTNAARYMQRFADRPFSTWRYLELSLEPSMARLGGQAKYFQTQFDEVMSKFVTEEFSNDKKLNGEFLLAYHCQRKELLTFSNTKTNVGNKEMEELINGNFK